MPSMMPIKGFFIFIAETSLSCVRRPLFHRVHALRLIEPRCATQRPALGRYDERFP
jgi:hypothetical protein